VHRSLLMAAAAAIGLLAGCGWESSDAVDDTTDTGACDTVTVFITSAPPNAAVYMNGGIIGLADSSELRVCVGLQQMRFVTDSCDTTISIGFGTTNVPLSVEVCPPDTGGT
jgi:hypothetical protein